MKRRVVITGLGTVNPMGNNVGEFWENIKNVNNFNLIIRIFKIFFLPQNRTSKQLFIFKYLLNNR